MAPLGYVLFPTSVQVNGDGRSLPVQHLVVTTWSSDQFTLNQPGFPIGDVNVSFLFTLLPCQGAAAAAMWAAWGKGGGGDGEDGICWLGEGKMWPEKQYKQQSSELGYTIRPPPTPPKKNTYSYLKKSLKNRR